MNLIFRMLIILIQSWFKPRLPIENTQNSLTLRVLPNDIDINGHMNNGRYLTICDLTRVDMFLRSGLAKTMMKEKWMPVISEHTMQYKKSLGLFQRYTVTQKITHWDDKFIYMNHAFKVKERIVAEGTSKSTVIAKGKVIAPKKIIDTVNSYNA